MIQFLQTFAEHAQEHPEWVAIIDCDGGRRTSYKELDDFSGRIAAYLKSLGIKKDSLVAIALEKGMEFVAVQMAVIKCGAAFVPLSKSIGEERIQFVLKDCEPDLIFDNDHLGQTMNFEPLPMTEWADSGEHDFAFIFYTSGSTGSPKGVVEEYGAYRFILAGGANEIFRPYCVHGEKLIFANIVPSTFFRIHSDDCGYVAFGQNL